MRRRKAPESSESSGGPSMLRLYSSDAPGLKMYAHIRRMHVLVLMYDAIQRSDGGACAQSPLHHVRGCLAHLRQVPALVDQRCAGAGRARGSSRFDAVEYQ